MPVYCDESGGVGAGVIIMAAVSLPDGVADDLLDRLRAVLGLRGELKGSRIALPERAFVIEMMMRMGARALIVEAQTKDLASGPEHRIPPDLRIYAGLLERVVDAWLPTTGGCVELIIDDGRYDARLNRLLRDDVQRALGQWGNASLADSRKSAGVQFADVLANSQFHIATHSNDKARIEALLAPFLADHSIRFQRLSAFT